MIGPGTKLGPYEVISPLGAGGMGEVYRARDERLKRDVAVKVLPVSLSADPDRLRRFEQEAQAAGALNHPNITAVYDIGQHDNAPYVVQELLEGETLRVELSAGRFSPRKAIDYALQITQGLAAAHEKGIVHRDLKPENLFVTKEGRVKILDFGLAKLTQVGQSGAETNLPTGTPGTEPGVVMGTLGYMSPEQVKGRPADARSDIFSFGAILYEMLSGKRAFHADSAGETMAAILREDPPDLSLTNENISPGLERILRHCLEKRAEERFDTARDLAFALETVMGGPSAPRIVAAPEKVVRRGNTLAVAFLLLVMLGIGVWLGGRLRAPKARPPITWHRLTFDSGTVLSAGFSGDKIVYSAAWNGAPPAVYSTRTDFSESRELVPSPSKLLSISKNGEMAVLLRAKPLGWFVMEGTLARVPADGGTPRELLEKILDADWSPDGSQLAIVRRAEEKVRLEFPPGHVLYETVGGITYPRFSPKGDRIAFLDHPAKGGHWGTASVVDLQGHKTVWSPVYEEIEGLLWSPSGQELWYGAEGERNAIQLFAAAPGRKPRLVTAAPGDLAPLAVDPVGRVLANRLSVRARIVCALPADSRPRDLAYLGTSLLADLSSDGRRILFIYKGPGAQENYDVLLRPTERGSFVRLGRGWAEALSPDGQWAAAVLWGNAAFGAGSAGSNVAADSIVLLPTAAGEPRTIPLPELWIIRAVAFHPDRRRVIFDAAERGKPERLWVREIEGSAAAHPISPPGFMAYTSDFLSPDGHWAVVSDTQERLWLVPVEGGEPKRIPGAEDGEAFAGWTGDGRAIHVSRYAEKLEIHRVDLSTGTRKLWKEAFLPDAAGAQQPYAVIVARDAEAWAAGYQSLLGELHLVDGLR